MPTEGARVEHDPVCGMSVTPGKAKGGSATYQAREYWFCNPKCREKFVADPAKYVENTTMPAIEPVAPPAPVTRVEYVCPMHPQIVRSEPGSCPICGMALEPR